MNVVSALVLFAVIWFVTLLVALPIGVTTQEEAGEVVPGTPASAPVDAMIRRKMLWVTVASLAIWAAISRRHRLGRDHGRGHRRLQPHVSGQPRLPVLGLRLTKQRGRLPMKILAALVTVLTLVSFGGAAFACDGPTKRSERDRAERRADHSAQTTRPADPLAGTLWACVPRVDAMRDEFVSTLNLSR